MRGITMSLVQYEIEELSSFDDFAEAVTDLVGTTNDSSLVVFPELVTLGLATMHAGWTEEPRQVSFARVAEHTDAYLDLFSSLARANGQTIVGGSHLVGAPGGDLLNVGHVFQPDGSILRHVKTHIFPGEAEWHTIEGDLVDTVVDVGGVEVGLMICYESEVPEVASVLTRKGAELLVVPSFTFFEVGFNRVRSCLAARCIENQVYAAHCSTFSAGFGPMAPGYARSSVLGPCDEGTPVDGVFAEAAANRQEVLTCTLDLDLLSRLRAEGAAPTLADRARRGAMYRDHLEHLLP